MPDRDQVLDFMMLGGSVRAAAERFGMPQSEVRELIQEETARYADGSEIKREWALASRRLLRMEIAFHERAMEQMDPSCAVIALKCNERRATLQGGGSSQPSHLIAVMQAKTVEEQQDQPTSTARMLAAIRALRSESASVPSAERNEPEGAPSDGQAVG
jgi:hypothetical protein